jgi:anti-sigma B factor antagonist
MQLAQTMQGSTITFTIGGNLDATTCLEVRDRFDEAIATNPATVVVDLSGLRLIDSSGVGAIVSLFKRVRASGGSFAITGLNGQPLSIFRVLRLDKVFGVGEPGDAALTAGKLAPSPPPATAEVGSAHAAQTSRLQ